MDIVLVGYGKTGRALEKVATEKGHKIIAIIEEKNKEQLNTPLREVDVIIDFTEGRAFLENLILLLRWKKPLVVGTTGWYGSLERVKERVLSAQIGFVYGSNFSIGMQLFFTLTRWMGEHLARFPEYDCALHEVHHRYKKDAPSGTALSLARILLESVPFKEKFALPGELAQRSPDWNELVVSYQRIGNEKGKHIITFASSQESIQIEHQVFSRETFAVGALRAAQWVIGKKGFFNFSNIWQNV